MGKFAVDTAVRVTDDVPDSILQFIGREGVIYGMHDAKAWNLVAFDGGYKLGFRDDELVLAEEEEQEPAEPKRIQYVIFEGLPVSSYYEFIESASQAAADLAGENQKNYTVVQFEMLDEDSAPFLVANYQGVVLKTVEEVDRENEEN